MYMYIHLSVDLLHNLFRLNVYWALSTMFVGEPVSEKKQNRIRLTVFVLCAKTVFFFFVFCSSTQNVCVCVHTNTPIRQGMRVCSRLWCGRFANFFFFYFVCVSDSICSTEWQKMSVFSVSYAKLTVFSLSVAHLLDQQPAHTQTDTGQPNTASHHYEAHTRRR